MPSARQVFVARGTDLHGLVGKLDSGISAATEMQQRHIFLLIARCDIDDHAQARQMGQQEHWHKHVGERPGSRYFAPAWIWWACDV